MEIIRQIKDSVLSFLQWFIRRKMAIVIFLIFTLAIPVYVYYVTVIKPVNHAGQLLEVSAALPDTARNLPDPDEQVMARIREVEKIEMDKAWLKNRLALAAASDSVYLSVDLGDSIVNLEINGVVVRSCRITGMETSKRVLKADFEERLAWVSTPFNLQDELSTIPKIPYVIKEAPKDTLEAQAQSAKPIPPDTTSVFFTLFFDKNLVLEVEQDKAPHDADKRLVSDYLKTKNGMVRKESSSAVFSGRAPDHGITIKLEVSMADARAIYRGIPKDASLSLKL